jgi:nucleoside-diphosphate-sugar epimerase
VSTLIMGCGYLGQRVATCLRAQGEHVFGTVRSQTRALEIAAVGIEPVIADVLEPGSLTALPEVERVFYCVGFDRSAGSSMRAVYVDGLNRAIAALPRSVTRFVYASSTSVYGQTGGEWVDESSPTYPQHESGRICLEAEQCASRWPTVRDGSGSLIILRFAGLYGPGRVVRRSIVERGEPIAGDPHKFLNLIHIDDAAQAASAALAATVTESVFLISDDRPVTRHEYYSRIATLLGAPEPRFEVPRPGSLEADRDATSKRVANARMKTRLGVDLRYPDFTTGLTASFQSTGAGST